MPYLQGRDAHTPLERDREDGCQCVGRDSREETVCRIDHIVSVQPCGVPRIIDERERADIHDKVQSIRVELAREKVPPFPRFPDRIERRIDVCRLRNGLPPSKDAVGESPFPHSPEVRSRVSRARQNIHSDCSSVVEGSKILIDRLDPDEAIEPEVTDGEREAVLHRIDR